MDETEKAFDELFRFEGGVFPYEEINNPIYVIVLAASRALVRNIGGAHGGNLSVYVGLINNTDFGALSDTKDELCFIGIKRGTIDILLNIFLRMLARGGLVTFIENADGEKKATDTYDPGLMHAEQLDWLDIEKLFPNDFVRREMACQFVIIAIQFLVSHEYAHIQYGHIDYRHSPFGKLELKNPEGHPVLESEAFVFQALELIADDFAVGAGMLLLEAKHKDLATVPTAIEHLYATWPSMLRLWFFPVYTCFRIFGKTNKGYSLEADFYMPPAARANMVIEITGYVLEEIFKLGIGEQVLKDLFIETAVGVEEAFAGLSGVFDLEPIKFSLSDEVWSHMKKLQEGRLNIARMFAESELDENTCAGPCDFVGD